MTSLVDGGVKSTTKDDKVLPGVGKIKYSQFNPANALQDIPCRRVSNYASKAVTYGAAWTRFIKVFINNNNDNGLVVINPCDLCKRLLLKNPYPVSPSSDVIVQTKHNGLFICDIQGDVVLGQPLQKIEGGVYFAKGESRTLVSVNDPILFLNSSSASNCWILEE